jgi:hypothetical protein
MAIFHSHPSLLPSRHFFVPVFFLEQQLCTLPPCCIFFPMLLAVGSHGVGLCSLCSASPCRRAAAPFFPNGMEQRLPSPSSASPSRREEQAPSSSSPHGWRPEKFQLAPLSLLLPCSFSLTQQQPGLHPPSAVRGMQQAGRPFFLPLHASKLLPWPDLPPLWTPLVFPCAQISLSSMPHFLP